MGRRKKRKDPLDYISLPKMHLEPETKKSIFIIFILALGALSLLGLFDSAGTVGVYLTRILTLGFGWGKWLVPLILLTLGYLFYNEDRYRLRGISYLGFVVYFFSFSALLHFFVPYGNWTAVIDLGEGGGYLGYYSATVFYNFFGFWAGLLIILCLLLISLMLMFDTSLTRLIGNESIFAKIFYPFQLLFSRLFNREERDDEEE